jgi:hypothetical protein
MHCGASVDCTLHLLGSRLYNDQAFFIDYWTKLAKYIPLLAFDNSWLDDHTMLSYIQWQHLGALQVLTGANSKACMRHIGTTMWQFLETSGAYTRRQS